MAWQYLIAAVPILLFSLTFHEAAHAYVAYRRGDDTARLAGRLTLNPIPHIDLIGTIILPLVLILSNAGFIIGAAKPVPVDSRNLRDPRRDILKVSLAGPASNFLLAAGFFVLLQVSYLVGMDPLAFNQFTFELNIGFAGFFSAILKLGVLYNLVLGGFNLLPIPPLDGSSVLFHFLPPKAGHYASRVAPYGFIIIIVLLMTGVLSPYFTLFFRLFDVLVSPLF
ncbi:MAG: site-2 protease family protein [bacterium]|nr:site-2 protease family protein [bacterium]